MWKTNCLIVILIMEFMPTMIAQRHEFTGTFAPVNDMVCPFDSTRIIRSSNNWYIYYTKDNLPYGEIDSAVSCINIIPFSGSIVRLKGDELIPSRPLFVRDYEVRNRREKMRPNQLYEFYYMGFSAGEAVFRSDDAQRQSYSINYWEREGENSTDTVAFQTSAFLDDGTDRSIFGYYCHVTSKLERQEFLGSLYTVYFDSSLVRLPNVSMFTYAAIGTEFNPVDQDEYIIPVTTNQGDISIDAVELFKSDWPDVHMVLHTKDGFPSPDNVSNKTIRLVPNPDVQKDIRIQIRYGGIHFQEYTGLLSERPEGQDSIRHNIHIELMGENMCLGLIELVFSPPLSFRYESGTIEFTDKTSCILVKSGSGFRVNKNAVMTYGNKGNGMLALDGGIMYIEENAVLQFDAILVLKNHTAHHVYLGKNAKMKFGSKAEIWSFDGHQLYVHGYPWQVDMRWLERSSLDKIVFVEPIYALREWIQLFPSVLHPYDIMYSDHLTHQQVFQIYDLYGRKYLEDKYNFSAGIKIPPLPTGHYLLKSGNRTGRFVVL